jgi:uncharacterized membrane protein
MTMEDQILTSAPAAAKPLSDRMVRIAGVVLSVIGGGFMAYLVSLHFAVDPSSLCDLSENLNCSVVNQSVYSELFGIPISALGLLYFVTMLWAFLAKNVRNRYLIVTAFSAFSLVFGIYLSGVEKFILDSFCLFCEGSKAVMVLLIIAAMVGAKRSGERIAWHMVAAAGIVGVVFAAGTYVIQREPIGIPDYTAEAECLTEKGVVMYGAYWCPKCERQKQLFGDAFSAITYVECDPRGEGAEPERCLSRGISGTPTWLQETPEGTELGRLEGVQDVLVLAERFDCSRTE